MPIPATAGWQPFGLQDAWVYPFSGGVPGSGLDIPGIVQVTGAPQNTVVEHRGDNAVIAKVATFDSIDLTITIANWSRLALNALVGGAIPATVGTTPNQINRIIHASTDAPADSAIVAQTISKSPDGGATRISWPRCQPQNIPTYGLNDQEFTDLDVPMSAVANAANEMVIVAFYESATTVLNSTYTT